ncbi:MAG: YhcH/YjgK/YiaL family protein [bacterium]|uniref:YhcH/YjgK/YiaL family protein n=1 Tax=Candidatus Aphodosoma intestinipullorum TaxID=2840674 RepID=A0A940DMM0_9BACT|nr:YhcH/YjgK/YiaL family protein [Candidatus Aphodosoma intestinipullorum]
MIKDSLANMHSYDSLHMNFRSVFNIIDALNFDALEPGHIELDGSYVYINIEDTAGRGRDEAPLEAHRRYIDIQVPLRHKETFGYKPVAQCAAPAGDYDPDRDIIFYNDRPDGYVDVAPGEFIIFFPEDAHAPAIAAGNLFKMVVKVSVTPNMERPTL